MATDTYDTTFIFSAGGGYGGYTPQASWDDHGILFFHRTYTSQLCVILSLLFFIIAKVEVYIVWGLILFWIWWRIQCVILSVLQFIIGA